MSGTTSLTANRDFVVIDTEGKRILKEIAIVDRTGKLIYEAFNQEHPSYVGHILHSLPLQSILLDFIEITRDKRLVFHNAWHDLNVLQTSFDRINLSWVNFTQIDCTYKLAQQHFPHFQAYSLEYLAKKLNLKVKGHRYTALKRRCLR